MSQNKTVIQGLEPAETKVEGNSMSTSYLYSRGQNSPAKGTVVPGMVNNPLPSFGNTTKKTKVIDNNLSSKPIHTGKPVVGFLYSISKTPLGEFWPLHLGKNTIGQASGSDIFLPEATVSLNHAVIITRMGKSGIIAAIKDTESTNGTFINGEPIDFSAEECHDGDKITIGNNYEFLFILVDANKLGLSTNKDFIPVNYEDEDEDDGFDDGPVLNTGGTKPGGFDPFNEGPTTWGNNSGGYFPNGGTVGMDGTPGGGLHGGTVPM